MIERPAHATTVRFGWRPAAVALAATPWLLGVAPAIAAGPFALDRAATLPPLQPVLGGVAAAGALLFALALASLVGLRRVARGTPGRGRHVTLGVALAVHVPTAVALAGAAVWALEAAQDAPRFTFDAPTLLDAIPEAALPAALAVAALAAVSHLVALGAWLGTWWLVPRGTRRTVWVGVDVGVALAFAFATVTLPLEPPAQRPDAVTLPAIRLAVTAAFAVRLFARLIPPLLDVIEAAGFRALVAARHLRAKKSGFLATIGTLSVLAVALSSCSLTTTLSVMGGFRADLRRKILGSHAHVVVEGLEGAPIEAWPGVLGKVREVPGVVAAAPYVGGEVMVTSASNLAGAVLRGIEPRATAAVTDLQRNLVRGRLDYLTEPERLLELPPEETGDLLPLGTPGLDPAPPPSAAAPDAAEPPGTPAGPDPPAGAPEAPGEGLDPSRDPPPGPDGPKLGLDALFDSPARREVVPGIVVGRELARTLRLFVGDDVDVVSPLGELGPAGPIPKSRPFRVAAIFYSGMYEYDMKYAYVALDAAQRFLGAADTITGIEVKVDRIEAAPAVAAAIRRALGRDDLVVRDWQEQNRNLFGALALERLAMFIALGIAIVVAGFCVFGTLTLMVQEKGREVAILKTMGAEPRRVVSLFLLEGLLIGLFGATVGLGLGFVTCFAAEHFGIRMNPEVYYIDRLPVHMDAIEFGLVGVAAVLVCVLATVFPAVAASRLNPVEALRYE